MAASSCIQCRVDPQLKLRLQAIAVGQGLTESAVLKRLVIGLMGTAPASDARVLAVEPIGPPARVYVRLRRSDHALLRERAAGRGLASATYVSMLVRTHLRGMPPLPDRELAELRHAAGALGAVGRNLNQIAHVAHRTEIRIRQSLFRRDLSAWRRSIISGRNWSREDRGIHGGARASFAQWACRSGASHVHTAAESQFHCHILFRQATGGSVRRICGRQRASNCARWCGSSRARAL